MLKDTDKSSYLTTSQVCKILQISISTLYRWRREGLPHYRYGAGSKAIRFQMSEVEKWLKVEGEAKGDEDPKLVSARLECEERPQDPTHPG